jgi:hypothetical protein
VSTWLDVQNQKREDVILASKVRYPHTLATFHIAPVPLDRWLCRWGTSLTMQCSIHVQNWYNFDSDIIAVSMFRSAADQTDSHGSETKGRPLLLTGKISWRVWRKTLLGCRQTTSTCFRSTGKFLKPFETKSQTRWILTVVPIPS